MHGYRLKVIHDGEVSPTKVMPVPNAAEVMDRILKLLAAYPDCHRIHVYLRDTRVFSVDCTGANVED